ncbi:hypothetical protein ES702_01117 [subsurface metagenome]
MHQTQMTITKLGCLGSRADFRLVSHIYASQVLQKHTSRLKRLNEVMLEAF